MKPTEEQELVVHTKAKKFKVLAFAGAAKSTTLEMLVRERTDLRILLLCFNKPNQLAAERAFKGLNHVESLTTHALALASVDQRYRSKLVPNLRPSDITFLFNINYKTANIVINTMTRFLSSTDEQVNASHIDREVVKSRKEDGAIVKKARQLWEKMIDPESPVGMLHDGYLKLYQLSKPDLQKKYDMILFEEVQDANPVTIDIVQRQKKCIIGVVGDHHQSIYSFRGSVNALDDFKMDETYYLTKSFRFGEGVADIANIILKTFKNEKRNIVGAGKYPNTLFTVDRSKYYAFIARTNAAIFDEAVSVIQDNKVPHFVGGVNGYRMNDILDAYYLYAGKNNSIKGHLKSFDSWFQYQEFAEEASDAEANILIKIVEKYEHDIPDLIDEIKKKAVDNAQRADVTLATAHKSKGFEFDQVILANDYPDTISKGSLNPDLTTEDVNLLYVSLTRAERAIQINTTLIDLLSHTGNMSILSRNQQPDFALEAQQAPKEPTQPKQSLWLKGAMESCDNRIAKQGTVEPLIEDVKKLLIYLEGKREVA